MKQFRFNPQLGFVLVLVGLLLLPASLLAQTLPELSPGRLKAISDGCSSAKISLEQLQKRDAVSRINRGRAYDQMMTQISAFNSRLAYNKINLPELVPLASELQSYIDQFRALADREYLEHLIAATKFDCKNKPAEFYALIVQVREDRDKVVAQITKIDELIAQYRQIVAAYRTSLSPPPETTP